MAVYDSIRLEKGLYSGGDFTASLEKLDPSENYRGTELEGLDAYQRQLKRFGIRVSGSGSDRVEKFFASTDSSVLFPEFVARAVRTGMEQADILPSLVATVTNVTSPDYRSIASVPGDDAKTLKVVGQGAFIPETNIATKENLVTLRKRGRMLTASYEALRYQRLDLFAVTLRQIGAYIARSQLKDAVDVIINGDGNSNPADTSAVSTAGTLTYADLVTFWNTFDPYELNTLLVSPDVMAKLLNLTEFRDAAAGLDFHATGKMITPVGSNLLKSAAVPSGTLLGLDKNCALEMVKCGDILTEYDRLIDRQIERAAITCTAGFAKIFDDASKKLTV